MTYRPPTEAEMQAAREALAAAGSIDFQAEVARRMGPYGRQEIDESRVEMVGEPGQNYNLRAWYDKVGGPLPEGGRHAQAMELAGKDPVSEPDMIYTLGPKSRSTDVLPHEFRHRHFYQNFGWPNEEISFEQEERLNRLWDAWRAESAWGFQKAADRAFPEIEGQRERWDRMEALLDERKDYFLREEAMAAEEQQLAVPRGPIPSRVYGPHQGPDPDRTRFYAQQAETRRLRRERARPDYGRMFDTPQNNSAFYEGYRRP